VLKQDARQRGAASVASLAAVEQKHNHILSACSKPYLGVGECACTVKLQFDLSISTTADACACVPRAHTNLREMRDRTIRISEVCTASNVRCRRACANWN
jgi:hypothetical protein